MTSSTCCLGRHPPSPDGFGPRPAFSTSSLPPILLQDISPQEPFPSWSTKSQSHRHADAAAIQAIFEPKRSDNESERDRIQLKKSSSTLKAVKNRLKKHLSRDSGISKTPKSSKRHSRASVGASEEEIERRAELRRIRHKRIQEELSNEGIYDDDARSLSTVDAAIPLPGIRSRSSWTPGDSMPLSSLTLPDAPLSQLDLPPIAFYSPKGPTLEEYYYALISPEPTPRPQSEPIFSEHSTTVVSCSGLYSRRYSSAGHSVPPSLESKSSLQLQRGKRRSIPPLPSTPLLEPMRMPSIVDPAAVKSSWRLSFSADHRGEHLRKLSEGRDTPLPLKIEKPAVGSQSMSRWLRSQGLRSSSQAIATSEDTSNLETLASHSHTGKSDQEFGGVDGVGLGDSSADLHLHEMRISQRLASKGLQSSSSSPQLSSVGSRTHQRRISSTSGNCRMAHQSRARYLRNTSDSIPLSECIPETWGSVLENGKNFQDGTSSVYPSAGNSIQPSPQSSRFNLFSLLAGSRSRLELISSNGDLNLPFNYLPQMDPPHSTFIDSGTPQTPVSQRSIPMTSVSANSLLLPLINYTRRPTIDNSSIIVSETESFREREVELSVVKQRFASIEARRSPSTPLSSKFREEFEVEPAQEEVATPSRPSALSRLAKLAARSYDGPFEVKLGVPASPLSPSFGAAEQPQHRTSYHSKETLMPGKIQPARISLASSRGDTLHSHADPHSRQDANSLQLPGKRTVYNPRKKSQASGLSRETNKKRFAIKGLGWGGVDKGSSSGESEKELDPEDAWEAELAKVAQKAKGRSRAIVKNYNFLDKRYPASWSRFSSHDRDVRVSSAGASDSVAVADFATDGSEFIDVSKKTLRERLQKRFLAEFDKQATVEVQNNTEGTYGRRSSMRPAGNLAYPELELLALNNVSLMSHEEISEHVEEVLKEEELDRKEEELDAIFGPVKKGPLKDESKPPVIEILSDKTPERKGGASAQETPTTAIKLPVKVEAKPPEKAAAAPVRRGPVARRPGEQGELAKPRPALKIAPPVVMPARGGTGKSAFIMGDGSVVFEEEDSRSVGAQVGDSEDDEVSIADPRFYDDCIVTQRGGEDSHSDDIDSEDDGRNDVISVLRGSNSVKEKYRTWSGRDWNGYRFTEESPKKRRSLGDVGLRESTDEVLRELEVAEGRERERVLRAVEEAWGGDGVVT